MSGAYRVPAAAADASMARSQVIRSVGPRAGTLLSDGPFALAGGCAMAPDALPSTLPLDAQVELKAHVVRACRLGWERRAGWLTLPPALLVGPPGVGRLHAARQIARYAGIPHCVWDLGSAPPGYGPLGPDVAMPEFPMLALLASGCANPVISVVGAGATSPFSLRILSDMMHGPGSPAWVDQSTGLAVDLSNVSWLVSWDEGDVVPSCIADRLEVVRMPAASSERFPLVALGVLDEVLAEYWIAFRDDPDAPSLDALLHDVGRGGIGVSELYQRTAEFVLAWLQPDAD